MTYEAAFLQCPPEPLGCEGEGKPARGCRDGSDLPSRRTPELPSSVARPEGPSRSRASGPSSHLSPSACVCWARGPLIGWPWTAGRVGGGGVAALAPSRRREERTGRERPAPREFTPTFTVTTLGRRCGPAVGAGSTRGTARGKRRPALALPSPSWAARRPLPLLPSSREREGEDGGWAGSFAALWSPASEALAKQPRERAAGSARARAPLLGVAGTRRTRDAE